MRRISLSLLVFLLSFALMSPSVQAVISDDLPADAQIFGTVTTSDATPVGNAQVDVVEGHTVVASTLTSMQGAYRFDVPDGSYALRVTSPDATLSNVSTLNVQAPRNWPLDLVLTPRTPGRVFLSGDVSLSSGQPLTSGTVLYAGAGDRIQSNGFFSSSTLPGTTGTWSVNAKGATGERSELILFASGGPSLTILQDTYVDLVVPLTTTRVVVTDSKGAPAANVYVRMNSGGFGQSNSQARLIAEAPSFNTGWTAMGYTDSDGVLQLPRVELSGAAKVTLIVDPPSSDDLPYFEVVDLSTTTGEFTASLAPRTPVLSPTPTPIPEPTNSNPPSQSPSPSPSSTGTPTPSPIPTPTVVQLTGVVSLSNGELVPGAVVIPKDPTAMVNGGNSTDTAGRYSVTKPAGFTGNWMITCRAQSSIQLPDPLCFSLTGGEVKRRDTDSVVNFTIPMNLYRVKVIDETGAPVPNVSIVAAAKANDAVSTANVDVLSGEEPFRGSWRGFDVTGSDGWAQVPGVTSTNTIILDVSIGADDASRYEGRSIRIASSELSDTIVVVGLKAPTVSGFTPTRAEPGQEVTLSGSNFLAASSVSIGNVNADFTVLSNTSIRVQVPSDAQTGAIQVTTAGGNATTSTSLTVLPPALTIATSALGNGQVGSLYREEVTAQGGVAPYKWRILGTRPSGLTMSIDGVLAGTPARALTRNIVLSVTDSTGKRVSRSVPIAIAPRPITTPGPVRVVKGTAASQRISLQWLSPANVGGSSVVGYRIDASTDQGETWQVLVANTRSRATGRSIAYPANIPTVFRVAAINAVGPGDLSAQSQTSVLTAYGPPSPPTGVSATVAGSSLNITWTAPSNNGGANITGYRIRISVNGRSWSTVTSNTKSTATTFVTQQRLGRYYWIQVSAINAGGLSPYSMSETSVYLGP